jgi:hypothetical protein
VYLLHFTALGLSALHHLDHVVRGTHVGWPVTAEANAFTYTLLIYPVIGLGFVVRSRAYWLAAAAGGLALVTAVHFGPFAVERTSDIVAGYAAPLLGYAAVAVLIALVAVLLAIVFMYARGPRSLIDRRVAT